MSTEQNNGKPAVPPKRNLLTFPDKSSSCLRKLSVPQRIRTVNLRLQLLFRLPQQSSVHS